MSYNLKFDAAAKNNQGRRGEVTSTLAINPDPTIACARRPKNGFRCALLEHQRAAIFPHTLGGACVGRPRACAGSARCLSRTIRGDENVGSGLRFGDEETW
jgi:hypothetical protein